MYETLKMFETKYALLKKKGLKVNGLTMVDPKKKKHVINVSKPFIFDNRALPKKYEGLEVKSQIQGELPEEFKIDRNNPEWSKVEYIWAPERFEKFVDRCAEEIRAKLNNPSMSRQDMLDALCFGNFEEHKIKSEQLIKEGKLPAYRQN
jgi:hypothetical protein